MNYPDLVRLEKLILMDNNFLFTSASVSDRGLSDKRPVNEDSFVELSELGLFAVADGVGGAQAGDFASQMAMETLSEAFHNLPENFDAEQALRIAIQHANQSIHTMSSELPQLSSMATTIAALHLNGNIATVAHVGDSRVYRIEPDGTLKRETADHSVVEEEVRAGRLTPEQALVHPSRNVISRALGAEETVDIDIKTTMVEPGTMFLLCSDGITRHIEDQELEQLFSDEIEPQALCEQMKSICYSRGAEDNLTAVVVRVSGHLAGVAPAMAEPISEAGTIEQPPPVGSLPDPDEVETVATARSPFDEPITEATTDAESPAADTDDEDAYLLETPLEEEIEEPQEEPVYASESIVVPTTIETAEVVAPVATQSTAASPFSYALEEEKPAGSSGRIFPMILMLLLGGAIGFASLWFWQQYNPPPQVPVLTESKSNNIPLSSFEDGRRLVDTAPERYLAANAASPANAEDHYLLGRAQLLTGKYVEAKRQFTLAKERLGDSYVTNTKTLAADIALGLAIADNPAVAEAFAREIEASRQSDAASNTNVNVNAAANANAN